MHKHCPTAIAIAGFCLAVVGFLLDWYIIPMLTERVKKSSILEKDALIYELWRKPLFPVKIKIYFFHVLNTDEVQNGANPKVQQRGPYIYDEYREKYNITSNKTAGTVTYYRKRIFLFNSEDSGCRSEEDEVTIINPSIVGTSLQVESIMPSFLTILNEAVPHLFKGATDAFLREKVKNILFDGVRVSCQDPEVAMVCSGIGGSSPVTIRPDTKIEGDYLFSMLNHLNNSEQGPFEIYSGSKNVLQKGIHKLFMGSSYMKKWLADSCDKINGTDGYIYPTMMKPLDRLYIFSPEICRSIFLDFEKKHTIDGLPVFRYIQPPNLFAQNEENKCFCKPGFTENSFDCPPNGTLDLQTCVKGPVLLSNPHFLHGDVKLKNYVTGLEPVEKLHGTYVDIEPFNGVPLNSHVRFQYNVHLKRFDSIDVLANVSDGIFPILWTDQGVLVPKYINENIRSGYNKAQIMRCTKWIFLVTGICVMLGSLVLILFIERLFCFSKINKISISRVRPFQVENTNQNSIGEVDKNDLNPNLYPQIENKNVINNLRHFRVTEFGGPVQFKF